MQNLSLISKMLMISLTLLRYLQAMMQCYYAFNAGWTNPNLYNDFIKEI